MDFDLLYPDVVALLRSVEAELGADVLAEAGMEDAGLRAMVEACPHLVLVP